jgi:putative FmdB family regulatory protein
MPLYEYQCQACSHRYEKIQKFSDPLEDVCPSCGGKVEKLVSSPAIQFKGSGWYITDYAKKSSSDGSSGKSSSDAVKSSSEKKTDSSSSSSSGDSASSPSSTPAPAPTSTSKE